MQAARGASLTGDERPVSGPTGHRSRLGLILAVAAAAWLLDIVTKVIVVHQLGDEPVKVVGSLLQLHLTRNAGAAFSTGTSLTAAIAVFGCFAFLGVCWLTRRVGSTVWAWAFGLLLAGIGGNLTDRFFRSPGPLRGHVIDFLELPHWPIFNVADVCINVAAALIVLQSVRGVGLSGRRDSAGTKP
ncbi:MAG: signal peptidase II [Marmoricola sp.]